MNLQPTYFDYIKTGTKRIELRLYDEKRQQIALGDTIEFAKSEQDKFQAKVIGLLRYASFADLFQDFDISILADASMTKPELLAANTVSSVSALSPSLTNPRKRKAPLTEGLSFWDLDGAPHQTGD